MAFVGCLSSEQQFVLEEGDIKDERGGRAVHVKIVNRYGGDNKSATEDKDLSTNLKLKDGKSMEHIKQMSNSKERSYSPKAERGCLKDGKKSMQHINKKNHQRLSKGAWPNTSLVAHHCPMAVGTPG